MSLKASEDVDICNTNLRAITSAMMANAAGRLNMDPMSPKFKIFGNLLGTLVVVVVRSILEMTISLFAE